MGDSIPLSEPAWFYLSFGSRPNSPAWRKRQPLEHAIGFREITHIVMTGPFPADRSASSSAVLGLGTITLATGPEYLLEIIFDGGNQQRCHDFRPTMPLMFRW
jgi:hypothetical protein